MKKPKNAKAIMTTPQETLTPDLPIYEAVLVLVKQANAGLPVVDSEGNCLGEFNEQSCLNALLEALLEGDPNQTVGDHLRPHQVSVEEETSLAVIAEKFQQTRQRILPVVKNNKTVGQITRRNVILAVLDYLKEVPDKKRRLLYLSALREPDEAPDFQG